MKYAIHTFGCRVNQADSFAVEEDLRARGGIPVPAEAADLVVVNTCTVTRAADQAARNLIHRVARRNASARIIVTGCYATREPDALASMPGVVHLVSNRDKEGFFGPFRGDSGSGIAASGASEFGAHDGSHGMLFEPGTMGRTAYPLRVQTGCDERCAFCVVPSTRGESRSRPVAEVLAEVDRLARAGYKEVWLVGVHLGSYGRDFTPRSSLGELLRALDAAPGDVSFRLSSLEPMDCPRELVDLVAGSGRFAPHFHLPLQHASGRVLAAMRRPYTFGFYADLVEHIHARLPQASIGTDVIVGFPGELEQDALANRDAIAKLPLSYLHVFPYSDRPGTAAAAMAPKIAPIVIKERARHLRERGAQLSARFARSQVGTVRPGLTIGAGTTVLTDNFLKVAIPPGLARNVRVNVLIESGFPGLAGRIR